jgi:cytochrome b561
MILRFIIRIWSARPATATTGSPLLDRLASVAHYSLYVIVFLMIASGWSTGWLRRMWFGERTIVPPENIERSGHRPFRRA